MPFMPWTPELELGLPEIDDQHRQLVALTNALYDELQGAAPQREEIGTILEALVDYTHNHFIVEEDLFQRYGYPQTADHQDEHNGFASKVMALLARFEGGEDVSVEVLEFLKDWLAHHICQVDRAYLPFLRAALEGRQA